MTQNFFFTEAEAEQGSQRDDSNLDLDVYCLKCGLYRKCKHPKMEPTGDGLLKCLIIAEASGENEDLVGRQLVGKVGKFFRKKLKEHGLLLDKHFFKTNTLDCRPHSHGVNRTPTDDEIRYCRPRLLKAIDEIKPNFIWLMGGIAIKALYMDDFKNKKMVRWRGLCIPDPRFNAWVLPMYHPSYPMREEKDYNLHAIYDRDLKNAIRLTKTLQPYEFVDYNKKIKTVTDYPEAVGVLEKINREARSLTFDYETNSKKPYIPGAKIATIAACYNSDVAYSLPYQYANHFTADEQKKIKALWRRIILNKDILKVAQNLKFEHVWTKEIFNVKVRNWRFDTMIASHILDNREGYTGLKFQSFLNFGVLPYDKNIKPYLKAKRGHINNVMKAPLNDLLHYGGLDAILTHCLKKKQINELISKKKKGIRLYEAYKFFHDGSLALANMERTGVPINEEYYHHEEKRLEKEIEKCEHRILNSRAAKKFKEYKGRPIKIGKDISATELRTLFFDVLGKEPFRYTDKKGDPSVDAEMLAVMKHPVADDVLKRRRLLKIKSNYLGQFFRENINGRLHPFFDLHLVPTYRGNAYEPSFHNIPKRDEDAKKSTRSGIVPSKGRQIGDVDFGGIEVCVGCCYHKDPAMIKYLKNPQSDMHKDAGVDVWLLPKSEITKQIRFFLKNQWVFPQFYGSYYANCAPNLWETSINLKTASGLTLKQHLADQHINNLYTFEEHLKTAEDKLWKRFKVYKQWKNDINKDFRLDGYIETFLGFRFVGPMSFNEVTNYPIQGTAFHLLLWTLIKITEVMQREMWRTDILAHIHDQLIFDFEPPEIKHIFKTVNDIGTKQIKKVFRWINVPLTLEAQLAPLRKSWYDTKEVPIV